MTPEEHADKDVVDAIAQYILATLAEEALDKFGWRTTMAAGIVDLECTSLFPKSEAGEIKQRDYDRVYIALRQMIDGHISECEEIIRETLLQGE